MIPQILPPYSQQIAVAEPNPALLAVLFRMTNAHLRGTVEWLVASCLFSAFSVGATVAYLVTETLGLSSKGYLTMNYISLVFSVVWLSAMTRDSRKAELYRELGWHRQEFQLIPMQSVLRKVVAWSSFAISMIFFVVGMAMVADNIVNGVLAEAVLMISTFLLVKTVQDRTDATTWAQMQMAAG